MPYAKPYARPYTIALGIRAVKTGIASAQPQPSIAHHAQSPSKAPNQASKAHKSASLGQCIGHTLKRAVGPLNRPHQNGAKAPLDSMVKRGTRAHTRA